MASVGKSSTVTLAVVLCFIFILSGMPGQAAAVDGRFDHLVDNLKNGNKEQRIAAIEELSGMKDEGSLAALIDEFQELHEDWHLRIMALDALAASGKSMVTDALVDGSYDSCPAIKWHSVHGLGGYAGEKAISALVHALRDSTTYIREAAVESLGRIRAREAVPYIAKALHDRNFAVRLKATVALGRIGGEKATSILEWEVQNEKDLFIKDEAASILKRSSPREEVRR